MAYTERVIILVDMDCFYCQVEEKLDPNLEGKPIAVVQYNAWRGGGIIAVNYPAREKGVTRHMRGDEAKQKCPEIVLARVPEVRGKADLTKYREAGKRVAEVLQTFTPLLERASVDEAYLDITEAVNKRIENDFTLARIKNMRNTYVVGYETVDFLHNVQNNGEYSESNCKLAMGGLIAEEIRAEVFKKTGYKCSAGIAHNKILAKLVCGLHKPNKQTILPQESIAELYKDLPIRKIKSLGGKFGAALSEELQITNMGELIKFSVKELQKRFDEKTAKWLYNIARGIDLEPVTKRLVSKSIGCCKKFPGLNALVTPESVQHWMNELASEICERLEKDLVENNRRAKQMVISFVQEINKNDVSSSRTIPLNSYDQAKIAQAACDTTKKFCLKADGTYHLKFLGLSVGNFEDNKKNSNIATFLKNMGNPSLEKSVNEEETVFPKLEKKVDNSSAKKIINTGISSKMNLNSFFQSTSLLHEHQNVKSEDENDLKDEVSDDECKCDENTSVYSAATEELNEDEKSLIYYEDIYPDDAASQPILERSQKDISNSTAENVSNKRSVTDSRLSIDLYSLERVSTSSFFAKYFENCPTDDSGHSSPIMRHFDTSKILEENEMEYSTENVDLVEMSSETTQEMVDKDIIRHIKTQVEVAEEELSDDSFAARKTCPECNKTILSSEMISHMDYHYALKMVKEEAHLYKQKDSRISPHNLKIEKKIGGIATKRKVAKDIKVKEIIPIDKFLQRDQLHEENSELCSECNKRIRIEDIVNHFDYHAAKKLHSEINSNFQRSSQNKMEKISVAKAKNKMKIKSLNTKSISSFFKSS